jgi:cytochrome P450
MPDDSAAAAKTKTTAHFGPIPDHVPRELVFDVDFLEASNTQIDPFKATDALHTDYPPLFYTNRALPGVHNGHWVVSRAEDIRRIYLDTETYSNEGAASFQTLVGETFRMLPTAADPPEHTKFRLLLNPWFSPKAITDLEPNIRGAVRELIDGFADKGECDVAYDFGRIYPVKVFLNLMGFPVERFEEFLAWEYALLHSEGDVEAMKWGLTQSIGFVREFMAQVREAPNEKLGSHIVHAAIDGKPLAEEDIVGALYFLWVGGLDTVAANSALMFRRLALQPDVQQALRDNPALIPDAVEEFLRFQPVVNSMRLVTKDHELYGQRIKAGDHIILHNKAGNFDPAAFPNPRELRFDRGVNRHNTLAFGVHICLGAHLARRELRIALDEFLRRIPPFRIKPGATTEAVPGLIAMPRLPLVWDI